MSLYPAVGLAELKTWTGYGGDTKWTNALNWSNLTIPVTGDDVLLDNGDLPVSYQVVLPDQAVTIRTIRIWPSPGRNIELILPSSNSQTDAFTVTGPGYGIELEAGAIFRNASGLTSGESLSIADSMIIHDGGRYVHQTRAGHANSILRYLSTAPGTEQGIFDFDVPRASYTISVSNRIYGSLELHSTAFGSPVNYTCTGANPLWVRGNLRIGADVTMSMNLSGALGNMEVDGDFIQEGGSLNLASGVNDKTILRIKGDLYQSPSAIITETNSGFPSLELYGNRIQQVAVAGQILNQVGFRMNNPAGAELRLPLNLPWKLELLQGPIYSTSSALLTLEDSCRINADSSKSQSSYVDGPLRKLGVNQADHFLFPVGKNGNLRWLEVKNASGDFTVEYFRENPITFGAALESGIDHISKTEYWSLSSEGAGGDPARVELSYTSALSGGVTDPDYLIVSAFQTGQWENEGHSNFTGNDIQGSVVSGSTNFFEGIYTLASTENFENPLPLLKLDLSVNEHSGGLMFAWNCESTERADHFDLYEKLDNRSVLINHINAIDGQTNYYWISDFPFRSGNHYFQIYMTDIRGKEYPGKLIRFDKELKNKFSISQIRSDLNNSVSCLLIDSDPDGEWQYEFISMDGRILKLGSMKITTGLNYLNFFSPRLSQGPFAFVATDPLGNKHPAVIVR